MLGVMRRTLAREQLICGTQVHIGIDDRDESVAVANRVSAYVPTLLALSASSPFWSDGSDTGYSSVRTLVWQRWPTTGLAAPVSSAAEYDKLVAELVASGAIADDGMVYFDVRPAVAAPTLELRVCDSCPSVDTKVLIAGTSAARQRRALRRRGRLTDVVDQLIAETAGTWQNTAAAVIEDPTLLFGYQRDREYDPADKAAAVSYDEAVDPTGRPQPRYEKILHAVADLGVAVLRSREGDVEQDQRAESITFRVNGQNRAQVFPLDLM